jgi:hypothetical protein
MALLALRTQAVVAAAQHATIRLEPKSAAQAAQA